MQVTLLIAILFDLLFVKEAEVIGLKLNTSVHLR